MRTLGVLNRVLTHAGPGPCRCDREFPGGQRKCKWKVGRRLRTNPAMSTLTVLPGSPQMRPEEHGIIQMRA
jgi:hypothetical protein